MVNRMVIIQYLCVNAYTGIAYVCFPVNCNYSPIVSCTADRGDGEGGGGTREVGTP